MAAGRPPAAMLGGGFPEVSGNQKAAELQRKMGLPGSGSTTSVKGIF